MHNYLRFSPQYVGYSTWQKEGKEVKKGEFERLTADKKHFQCMQS